MDIYNKQELKDLNKRWKSNPKLKVGDHIVIIKSASGLSEKENRLLVVISCDRNGDMYNVGVPYGYLTEKIPASGGHYNLYDCDLNYHRDKFIVIPIPDLIVVLEEERKALSKAIRELKKWKDPEEVLAEKILNITSGTLSEKERLEAIKELIKITK